MRSRVALFHKVHRVMKKCIALLSWCLLLMALHMQGAYLSRGADHQEQHDDKRRSAASMNPQQLKDQLHTQIATATGFPKVLTEMVMMYLCKKRIFELASEFNLALATENTPDSVGNVALSPNRTQLILYYGDRAFSHNIDGTKFDGLLSSYHKFAAWSPSGEIVAIGRNSNEYYKFLYKMSSTHGEPELLYKSPHIIAAVAFSPTGDHIAVALKDRWCSARIVILDSAYKEIRQFAVLARPQKIIWSAQGTKIAVGRELNPLTATCCDFGIYDVAEGRQIYLENCQEPYCAWSPTDDNTIATRGSFRFFGPDGGDERTILWNASTGKPIKNLPCLKGPFVVWDPSGKKIVTLGETNKTVQITEIVNGECVQSFKHTFDWVSDVVCATDMLVLLGKKGKKTVCNVFKEYSAYEVE